MQHNELNLSISNAPLDESRQGEVLTQSETLAQNPNGKRFYIESYGCQMNFNDSEIVASILNKSGFGLSESSDNADLILLNTCSIREKAEERIRKRLQNLNYTVKKQRPGALIGILGCMAERLKKQLLEEEQIVDIVVGPDAYRDLPRLVEEAEGGQRSVNVLLSREETYGEINPIRLDSNGVTAFVSIMRGCDNMCSFCVVPFTRGRERSRNAFSIVAEVNNLSERGYGEVTLLGQNVDSYKWQNPESGETVNFAQLLEMVALVNPKMRVRFSTSHPKDITDEVLYAMKKHDNICKYIHLPVQSGSSRILEKMNRTYDRDWYLERVAAIHRILPDCAISTDVIAGFCSETEEDHQETLSLMEAVKFDMAYMFMYSERPGTLAERRYKDDVPNEIKKRRLKEIIQLQNQHSLLRNKACLNREYAVLVEKTSKRSNNDLAGRTDQNKMVNFARKNFQKGDYAKVQITDCTSASLRGVPV